MWPDLRFLDSFYPRIGCQIMISISRPHRQMAATAMVVVAMILPTFSTLWWAFTVNRPGHVRDVEVRLSRALGLQVGLEAVDYPRPGEIVLTGAIFRQEEPRGRVFREVARARQLTLKPKENVYLLEGSDVELFGDSSDTALAQIGLILQKASIDPESIRRMTFAIDRCRMQVEHGAGGLPVKMEWRSVAGSVESRHEQAIVQASAWHHEADRRTRCELKLTRKRQGQDASTHLSLATMEGPPLPCNTLEPIIDMPGWLGEKARLQGQLTLSQVENQPWEAQFSGSLEEVDLSRMINGRFGSHRLTGVGQVQVKQAIWGDRPGQGSGWREIQGDLTSGPGKASQGLLLAMGQQMRFRLAPNLHTPKKPSDEVDFGSFGLQFHLTEDGQIQFGGACGPDFGPDVVAISTQAKPTPIMAAPKTMVNVRGLLKTLFPVNIAQAELLVPTTRESQSLQRYLPMPSSRLNGAQVLPASHQ
ncbi:MAG: hypothetical protein DWI24_09330 [Planctomycetota bacterium]|nr:MAG: hypothetical protein DWI24_09330 [Planctomycetota bacterium]